MSPKAKFLVVIVLFPCEILFDVLAYPHFIEPVVLPPEGMAVRLDHNKYDVGMSSTPSLEARDE